MRYVHISPQDIISGLADRFTRTREPSEIAFDRGYRFLEIRLGLGLRLRVVVIIGGSCEGKANIENKLRDSEYTVHLRKRMSEKSPAPLTRIRTFSKRT
jgi:hypothetical protein